MRSINGMIRCGLRSTLVGVAASLVAGSTGIYAQAPLAAPGTPPAAAITLDDAIQRATFNDPAYRTAVADRHVTALDRSIARSALLPNVTYHAQYLYTQPNGVKNAAGQVGSQPSPRFIANNAIREYASQALVNETVSVAGFADLKRAGAVAAQAAAAQEIARRDLIARVVSDYYTLLTADQRERVQKRAEAESENFAGLTQKLENGREVAHADVVKSNLQLQQRQRDLADAALLAEKARLELGILLFPDPKTPYVLADDTTQPPPSPSRADVNAAAARNNPDLRSALAALAAANQEVLASRAGYLPDLALNYSYGIDAPQFATKGPFDPAFGAKPRNLGYSAAATLDIPVWNWFATHDRVKQSEWRRETARVALTYAQKRLVADLDEFYSEVTAAERALGSLDQSVQTAGESLRLTNMRYRAGEATVLEVVDAQNALTTAETARGDGTVRYRVALANLQTITGAL